MFLAKRFHRESLVTIPLGLPTLFPAIFAASYKWSDSDLDASSQDQQDAGKLPRTVRSTLELSRNE